MGWMYLQHLKEKRTADEQFSIVAIVQTTPDKESLQTVYLAELLELSIDRRTNLYLFDTESARQKLLACPVIKSALVKKVRPGTVFIDYSLRRPIAYIGDFMNMAADSEGAFFPVTPFFTPKKLPEFILGINQAVCDKKKFNLAMNVLMHFTRKQDPVNVTIQRIDVSHAFDEHYGRREIVVALEELLETDSGGHAVLYLYPRLLRLNAENYEDALVNYLKLQPYLREKQTRPLGGSSSDSMIKMEPAIIDLRLPSLAYIKTAN